MRKKSSKRWLQEHFKDPYVKMAFVSGYRSRAAYKLIELQEKDHLFKPGMVIVELGAAPGGWTQVLHQLIQPGGKVIALDILPMTPISGVDFIQGDFTQEQTLQVLTSKLQAGSKLPINWVVSDMAPNLSGNASIDIPRSMYLAELALGFALANLMPEGCFLIKVFQGEGFDSFLTSIKKAFEKVMIRKPRASKAKSRELYIVAKGKRPI